MGGAGARFFFFEKWSDLLNKLSLLILCSQPERLQQFICVSASSSSNPTQRMQLMAPDSIVNNASDTNPYAILTS